VAVVLGPEVLVQEEDLDPGLLQMEMTLEIAMVGSHKSLSSNTLPSKLATSLRKSRFKKQWAVLRPVCKVKMELINPNISKRSSKLYWSHQPAHLLPR